MATPLFDKEGNLSNVEELTPQEVAEAFKVKNKEIYDISVAEREKAKLAKEEADKAKADLAEASKKKLEETSKPTPTPTPDEIGAISRIYATLPDDLIKEAKDLATGKGISLAEALETKAFKLLKSDYEEEQKREAAKLGASHGSGTGGSKAKVTSGMKREDHEAEWRKQMGMD